jgi:hypothetical protein
MGIIKKGKQLETLKTIYNFVKKVRMHLTFYGSSKDIRGGHMAQQKSNSNGSDKNCMNYVID